MQSDHTILLETAHPEANSAKHELSVFAELERAPEHFHTYRITRLGLWNARAAGLHSETVLETLGRLGKFPLPENVKTEIVQAMDRYGKLTIQKNDEGAIVLRAVDEASMKEASRHRSVATLLGSQKGPCEYEIEAWVRGDVKQALLKRGWPVDDRAGFTPGAPLDVELEEDTWHLRDYQKEAVEKFVEGGNGVVVLPCGAGKTIVGAAAMAETKAHTLILVTSAISAKQWRRELIARTTLIEEEIGEYSGRSKEVKPVTIATYQILSSRRKGEYAHLSLLNDNDWGLIIYDEVHLLPAPVFKLTAQLQARRRLGLTATLIREDGREGDVFSLIGPKRYESPWKELENQGFIAPAQCFEVRIELSESERLNYAAAEDADRYRLASSTPMKLDVVKKIIKKHDDEQILIIGQYLDQLEDTAQALGTFLVTGQTPATEREEIFQNFRSGKIQKLVVSKVANFSVDLPDASVAIQISGSFGSRQEEAQRLGRILRPKRDGLTASFYSLVTEGTVDQDFAAARQRFLAEQGYAYSILKDI